MKKVICLMGTVLLLLQMLQITAIPVSAQETLELQLRAMPNPTRDIDGATISAYVTSGGEPIEGAYVEFSFEPVATPHNGFFDDDDPDTPPVAEISGTTNLIGEFQAHWGYYDVCIVFEEVITFHATASKEGYTPASDSCTLVVLPISEAPYPEPLYGEITMSFPSGPHNVYVTLSPATGTITSGETVYFEIQLGREIDYESIEELDWGAIWMIPGFKNTVGFRSEANTVTVSLPDTQEVQAEVVEDEVMVEVKHSLLSDDWIPISTVENLDNIVSIVEWLDRLQAISKANWIAFVLGFIPDVIATLATAAYGEELGHGPEGEPFDPNNENVQLFPLAFGVGRFGVEGFRIRLPVRFLGEGQVDVNFHVAFAFVNHNQYVLNYAGAQFEPLSFTVTRTGRPGRSVRDGLAWLRCHQNPDGSWTYSGRITEESVGLTSMAATAFLNYGIGEEDPTVKKAIEWILSKQRPDGCITSSWYHAYDTSLAVLALVATRNNNYYDEIQAATNFLIDLQNDEDKGYSESDKYYGGWPYWKGMEADLEGWADLSNSQFVLLALHYAEEFNPDDTIIPADVWDKAEIFVTRCQNRRQSNPHYSFYDDGGFIYQPASDIWADGRSYGSMTTAGLWGFYTAGLPKTDPRVDDAIGWLESNYHVDQNYPIGQLFYYYYLYGLSKACVLWDIPTIDGHDWYAEMCQELINRQQADGHWPGTNPSEEPDNVATCWALLALETKLIPTGTGLNFEVDSPADLHVYDPEGRHVGINYDTGDVEIEIPGATYSGPETEPQVINISNPIAGTYTVKLVGRESGDYTYTVRGLVDKTVVSEESYTGHITPEEVHESKSVVSAIAGAIMVETNAIPIADANGPYSGIVGEPITFDGTGSYDLDGTIVSYEWDLDGDGEFDDALGANPTKTWNTPYSGDISLRVTDNEGATDVDTTTLTVSLLWDYAFEDPERGTKLYINIKDKTFQFITPDKDYGIREATTMYEGYVTVYYNGEYVSLPAIIIRHNDGELRLLAYAGTEAPFCYARAVDYETGKRYMLRVDPTPPE